MKPYQRQFIEFALSKQVLKFGEFTLKSGRKSPYFFNAGLFNTGRDLALLGRFYAEALVDSGIEFDLTVEATEASGAGNMAWNASGNIARTEPDMLSITLSKKVGSST